MVALSFYIFLSLSCRNSDWRSQGSSAFFSAWFRTWPRWTSANFNSLDSLCCNYFYLFFIGFLTYCRLRKARWQIGDSFHWLGLVSLKQAWFPISRALFLRKYWFSSALDNHSSFYVKTFNSVPCTKKIQNNTSRVFSNVWADGESKEKQHCRLQCLPHFGTSTRMGTSKSERRKKNGCVVLDQGCPLKYTGQYEWKCGDAYWGNDDKIEIVMARLQRVKPRSWKSGWWDQTCDASDRAQDFWTWHGSYRAGEGKGWTGELRNLEERRW